MNPVMDAPVPRALFGEGPLPQSPPMTSMQPPPPLTQPQRIALRILKELMKPKGSALLCSPVDVTVVTDYLAIVKTPMDLGTIRTKVQHGGYNQTDEEEGGWGITEQFEADVRLVFTNCKTYNPPGHFLHNMANSLSTKFDTLLEQHANVRRGGRTRQRPRWQEEQEAKANKRRRRGGGKAAGRIPKARKTTDTNDEDEEPADEAPSSSSAVIDDQQMLAQMVQLQQELVAMGAEIERLEKERAAKKLQQAQVGQKRKRAATKSMDMSYQEKRRLADNICSLPSTQLGPIMQVLERAYVQAEGQEEEGLCVDLEHLPTHVLRELEVVVRQQKAIHIGILPPTPPRSSPAKEDDTRGKRVKEREFHTPSPMLRPNEQF